MVSLLRDLVPDLASQGGPGICVREAALLILIAGSSRVSAAVLTGAGGAARAGVVGWGIARRTTHGIGHGHFIGEHGIAPVTARPEPTT